MQKCPNLSHPTYKYVVKKYGENAAYALAAFLDQQNVVDWKGDDFVPLIGMIKGNPYLVNNLGKGLPLHAIIKSVYLDHKATIDAEPTTSTFNMLVNDEYNDKPEKFTKEVENVIRFIENDLKLKSRPFRGKFKSATFTKEEYDKEVFAEIIKSLGFSNFIDFNITTIDSLKQAITDGSLVSNLRIRYSHLLVAHNSAKEKLDKVNSNRRLISGFLNNNDINLYDESQQVIIRRAFPALFGELGKYKSEKQALAHYRNIVNSEKFLNKAINYSFTSLSYFRVRGSLSRVEALLNYHTLSPEDFATRIPRVVENEVQRMSEFFNTDSVQTVVKKRQEEEAALKYAWSVKGLLEKFAKESDSISGKLSQVFLNNPRTLAAIHTEDIKPSIFGINRGHWNNGEISIVVRGDNSMKHILLHELTHHFSVPYIVAYYRQGFTNPSKYNQFPENYIPEEALDEKATDFVATSLTTKESEAIAKLENIYLHVLQLQKDGLIEFGTNEFGNGAYGMKNLAEFVAEAMSNPYFAGKLAALPAMYDKQPSLLKNILDQILKIFGIENTSLLTDIYGLFEEGFLNKDDQYNFTRSSTSNTSFKFNLKQEDEHQKLIDKLKEKITDSITDEQRDVILTFLDKLTDIRRIETQDELGKSISFYRTKAGKILERVTRFTKASGKDFGDEYQDNRDWGNEADAILSAVVNKVKDDEYPKPDKLTPEVHTYLKSFFQELIDKLTADGSIALTQTIAADEEAGMSGAQDVVIIRPDGTVDTYDLKTSWTSAWNADKSDLSEEYKKWKQEVHTQQLSLYQGLQEKMQLKTGISRIVPVFLPNAKSNPGKKIDKAEVQKMVIVERDRKFADNLLKIVRDNQLDTQKQWSDMANKVRVILKERISRLKNTLRKGETQKEEYVKKLQQWTEQLKGVDVAIQIASIIDSIYQEQTNIETGSAKTGKNSIFELTQNLDTVLKKAKASGNLSELHQMIAQLNSKVQSVQEYEDFDELIIQMAQSGAFKNVANNDSPLYKARKIVEARNEVEAEYYRAVRPLLAEIIAKEVSESSREAAQEYLNRKNKLMRELDQARQLDDAATVTRLSALYKEESDKFDKLHVDASTLLRNFSTTTSDLSWLEYQTGSMAAVEDPLLSLFAKKVTNQLRRKDEVMMGVSKEVEREFNAYKNATGLNQNDPSKFNKDLIELVTEYRNGSDGTARETKVWQFVTEHDQSAYSLARAKMYAKAATIKNVKDKAEFVSNWFLANRVPLSKEERATIIAEKRETLSTASFNNWYSDNVIEYEGVVRYMRDLAKPDPAKFPNAKWTNLKSKPAAFKYHQYITKLYLKSQDKYPLSKRMGYKLPSIHKALEDTAREEGLKGVLRDLKDSFIPTARDNQRYGFGKKIIPAYFTQYMPHEDVSLDIASSVLRFIQATEVYDSVTNIEPEATALLSSLQKRKVVRTDASGRPILKEGVTEEDGNEGYETKDGGGNAALLLEHWIDQVLYGQGESKVLATIPKISILGKEIGGATIDTGKAVNTAMQFASWSTIGGPANWLKAIANKLNAELNIWIEAFGGQFFNREHLSKGGKRYNTWFKTGFMDDLKSATPVSLEGQMMDYYSPIKGSFKDEFGREFSWDAMKKSFKPSSWFFLQRAGEHSAQMRMFFAMLEATKVTIGDKTIPFSEVHELKDGVLVVKGWDTLNQKQKDDFLRQKDEMIGRIHAINRHLHGIYNKMDKSVAQKHAVGRLLFMYRKYLLPGIQRRTGKMRMDNELGTTKEGYYRTFLRIIKDNYQDIFAALTGGKTTLTKMEIANARKACVELGLVLSLTILCQLLGAFRDDDEELRKGKGFVGKGYNALYYEAMRLASEFRFYTPFGWGKDWLRIFTSPSAANTHLEKMFAFSSQITNPFEEYETNSPWHKKGDSKLSAATLSLLGVNSADPLHALQQFTRFY